MYDMANLKKFMKLGELAPAAFHSFVTFDEAAFQGGAIPLKYKELMAVAVALTTQCPYCIEVLQKGRKRPVLPSRSWPKRPWSRRRCVRAAR